MLLIEASKIKQYFGDRLLLDMDHLKIYSEDRIGIVGRNGVGKTTFINILSNRIQPSDGWVRLYGDYAYISQLEEPAHKTISDEIASKFGVGPLWQDHMSGGEKTRFKLASAIEENRIILFADEPTSNVDMEGIELMEKNFNEYKGAFLVISHDRNFLDRVCNKILEIENGRIKIYSGNYTDYKHQKEKEKERAVFEYEEYVSEKKRLEEVMKETKERIKGLRKTPKRMGNSEARLHKMGPQRAKANLDRSVKSVEKRMEHLEVKEKPKEEAIMKLDVLDSNKLHSKIVVAGKNIGKAFGPNKIFHHAEFNIYNGAKVALIGPNGCGKSTLIRMILDQESSIEIAQGAKIGYFSQTMDILNLEKSILENVMESSIYSENFARLLLSRLLFKREDVHKKVEVLSGGERVKVSFAKIVLQDINFLILDEPTNYMDIDSLEVIEETLKSYDRTLLFVSHDRRFVDEIADSVMSIENKKIKMFQGTYQEYLSRKDKATNSMNDDRNQQIIVLKNRLSEVIGRLSLPSKGDDIKALDREYHKILAELQKFKA